MFGSSRYKAAKRNSLYRPKKRTLNTQRKRKVYAGKKATN